MRSDDQKVVNVRKKTLYYSGNNLPHHHNGVDFLVERQTNKAMNNFVAYSDRTALLQVEADPVDLNIVQFYAPATDKPDY